MRLRFLLLLVPGLVLSACEPALNPGPRVELIGSSRFTTTADRRLTTPADTIASKVYAEANGSPLRRLTITVEYVPEPQPIVSYDPPYDLNNPPKAEYTFLDTTISSQQDVNQFAFQSVLGARTTAGLEVWRYQVTDADNRTSVRSFRLRLVRSDSAAAYHSYTVPLQAAGPLTRRGFLALREGLALPKFAVSQLARNQALIDLVHVVNPTTGSSSLATVQDATLKLNWATRRATEIRRTSLTPNGFAGISTPADFTTAFNQGASFSPSVTSTGPLIKNQVLAFRTPDNRYGLILVQDIFTTGITTLALQVRVSK